VTTLEDRRAEVAAKLTRLRTQMAARQVDVAVLAHVANTAWITAGGATFVDEASDAGPSNIVVTADRAVVVTDRVEAPRLEAEEHFGDLGFTFAIEPWYARGGELATLVAGQRVGYDIQGAGVDLRADLRELRTLLQPTEQERLRANSQDAAHVMEDALRDIQPGTTTEFDISARLAAGCRLVGGTAVVNLVAADERIAGFRHPLPVGAPIQRMVMAVLCLRRAGLVTSITRLVHVGSLSDDLRQRALAVAEVDARLILGTQPGRTLGDMFALARDAYADLGFPDAIQEHHQGGSAGYLPREVLATPDNPMPIRVGEAFAWNPSVRGAKSEDTILLGATGPEILTTIADWPTWEIAVAGHTIARPAIKVLAQ
jgi:Xaa-Pro aminopeptidase